MGAGDQAGGSAFRAVADPERASAWRHVEAEVARGVVSSRSEQMLRALADNASDVVCLTGPDRRILWVGPSVTRTLGWQPDELIGVEFAELTHPDDRVAMEGVRTALYDPDHPTVSPELMLVRLRSASGSYHWMSGLPTPVTDEHGHLVGVVSGLRDVHELVLSRQEAVEERQRLRVTIDSLLDPHVTLRSIRNGEGVTVDFDVIDTNEAACRISGATRAEMLARSFLDRWPDAAANGWFVIYADAVETGTPVELDGQPYAQSNGRVRRFDVRGVRMDDGLSVSWRDVTTAFLDRQRLEETADLLARTSETAHVGGWEFDRRTREATWLPEVYRILDVDPADGLARGFDEFVPQPHGAELAAIVRAALAARESWDLETPAVTATGRPIWLRWQGMPVEEHGEVVAARGTVQDITDRKVAEIERERLAAQLREAAKMESIGRLAGGVAHDFNNMLEVILGRAEFALAQLPPHDRVRSDLTEIRDAALRAAGLTQQLLAFASQQTVAPTVIDLNLAVDERLGMLRRLIGTGIELRWEPAADLWPIETDVSQVDQILTNLCVNARDAIVGSGRIIVSTANCELDGEFCAQHGLVEPGSFVRLSVTDDGAGMDESTVSRIFEPFFTTKPTGTVGGLGLSTVYGAVAQNRGAVVVTSRLGHGTTFDVHFPRHHGELAEAAGEQPDSAVGASSSPLVQLDAATPRIGDARQMILVIEDEPAILELVAAVLESEGYQVLSAADSSAALLHVAEHCDDIRLVLSDVIMPGMNGRDLGRRLREEGVVADQLFISGYPADIIADRGILTPGVWFLQKPFTIDELCAKVHTILADGPPSA